MTTNKDFLQQKMENFSFFINTSSLAKCSPELSKIENIKNDPVMFTIFIKTYVKPYYSSLDCLDQDVFDINIKQMISKFNLDINVVNSCDRLLLKRYLKMFCELCL